MNNHTTLVGNLTRDPEIRYTTTGRPVANLGLAVDRRWQQNNEWHEQTSFFTVVVFGDQAENVAASLTIGDRVVVAGRLTQRTWETPDSEKRSSTEILADEIGPSLRFKATTTTRSEKNAVDGDTDDRVVANAAEIAESILGEPVRCR